MKNLGNYGNNDTVWQTLFLIICWLIWKDRNLFVFSKSHSCVQAIKDTSYSWARSYAKPALKLVQPSPMRMVSTTSSIASIRGVLRDSNANWLCGFSMMFDKEFIFKVEEKVVLEGLLIACGKGFRHVEVERDIAY